VRHIQHNQRVEKQSAPSIRGCHDQIDVKKLIEDNKPQPTNDRTKCVGRGEGGGQRTLRA
jgi:hypothetical protein